MPNAARDFSPRKWSYEAMCWKAWVRHWYAWSCASHRAGFITYTEGKACSVYQHLLLHIASSASYHIDIGFSRRDSDGTCIMRGMDIQTCMFDVMSQWKVTFGAILQCVIFSLMRLTKLRDMVIRIWMCKGRKHHLNDQYCTWCCKTANQLDFDLPISAHCKSKSNISDKIY